MSDWLTATLTTIPALLWIIVGLGVPYTLIILPRQDWQNKAMVACLSLAFGPALLTVWMFILGTLGMDDNPYAGDTLNPQQTVPLKLVGGDALLTANLILAGTVVLALIGVGLAWMKFRRTPTPIPKVRQALALDEKLLIGLIVVATVGRWFITSWLEFGAWDPLWVYGYQGRIYTLLGFIPADIGYYPQFLPLQYAYAQIVGAGGDINDHAARAVIPFLQIGSILAAYLLGSKLFSRRVGIFTAAIWALYPSFGYWTRIGDLEIPVTFAFTGAAAFLLLAWTIPKTEPFLRRRYAFIAGLFFGVAMWTKPTAGAFVLGAILLVVVEFLYVRGDWRRWFPRFEVALIAGIACIPLGALWYIRNMIIGHDAIVFPPTFWQDAALRSGRDFMFPLIALGILLAYVYWGPINRRPNKIGGAIGAALIIIGVSQTFIEPARMIWWEWLAFVVGLLILGVTLGIYALEHQTASTKIAISKIGWSWLLAFPYFITFFYSYSYHYRLAFSIVPLMILPTAVILAHWLSPERLQNWRSMFRRGYLIALIAVSLPGVMIFAYDESEGWDWLWTRGDNYAAAGSSLQGVVATIQRYIDTHEEPLAIIAPGLQPLPFYFPLIEIRVTDTPRTIAEMEGATHFIYSREGLLTYERRYEDASAYQHQWFASLRRNNVVDLIARYSDPSFFYEIYQFLGAETRFEPLDYDIPVTETVDFGEFVRFIGYSPMETQLNTQDLNLELVWEVLDKPLEDYTLYLHIYREDSPDDLLVGADGPVLPTTLGYYSTLFWDIGEYIKDTRIISQADLSALPPGEYRIRIGWYNWQTLARVPVTINGNQISDGYTLDTIFIRGE